MTLRVKVFCLVIAPPLALMVILWGPRGVALVVLMVNDAEADLCDLVNTVEVLENFHITPLILLEVLKVTGPS